MTAEEFSSTAIVCPMCQGEPELIKKVNETLFSGRPPRTSYLCQCPSCFHFGYKSAYCKSPESAVNSWNRKVISMA